MSMFRSGADAYGGPWVITRPTTDLYTTQFTFNQFNLACPLSPVDIKPKNKYDEAILKTPCHIKMEITQEDLDNA